MTQPIWAAPGAPLRLVPYVAVPAGAAPRLALPLLGATPPEVTLLPELTPLTSLTPPLSSALPSSLALSPNLVRMPPLGAAVPRFAPRLLGATTSHDVSQVSDAPPSLDARAPNYVVPILHDLALLSALRLGEVFIWPEPFANFQPKFVAASYEKAYTLPPRWDTRRPAFEWDGDNWTINVLGHGWLGSELYLRARQCHHGPWAALAFAASGSAVWEYVLEANAVRPSALDLVYTPLAGALFGEMRFELWHWARAQRTTLGSMFRVVLDPFGEFERGAGTDC